MPGIDLHTHSIVSDGQHRPAELVDLAAKAGLSAMALTDHDTMEGLEEALEAGRTHNIEVIPGCELAVVDGRRQLHILALWLRSPALTLQKALTALRASRHERNRIIVEKLRQNGVNIEYDEVLSRAQGAVGRPHIAQILLERGVVRTSDEAFKKYLGRQGRAFAAKQELSMDAALALLKAEGATVMLAHPYLLGENGKAMEELVRRYHDMGVDGLEAYYTEHSTLRTNEYLQIARKLEMQVSGGSDFHGKFKPQIQLGIGRGKLHVPEKVLDDLKEYRRGKGLWV